MGKVSWRWVVFFANDTRDLAASSIARLVQAALFARGRVNEEAGVGRLLRCGTEVRFYLKCASI
jgi:hypothetical protein